jgi:hypothetical protein
LFRPRDGKYVDALGQLWRDFMAGKLPALPGGFCAADLTRVTEK